MIPRLTQSSLSFKANESVSPREAYDSQMVKNSQTAQKQSNVAVSMAQSQIAMQGSNVGQKLDVIA